MASANGRLDCVRTLLEYGSNVNAEYKVRNQMMIMTLIIVLTIMMMMTLMMIIYYISYDDDVYDADIIMMIMI